MGFRQNLTIISVICATAAITVGFSASADDLPSRLAGRMLLQVEQNGEAWWVDPDTKTRVFLSRPSVALEVMRQHGLGISNADLSKIPVGLLDLDSQDQDGDGLHNTLEDSLGTNPSSPDSDDDGLDDRTEVLAGLDPLGPGTLPISNLFASIHAGRIFIQVESRGEAWWINPADNHRYYLGRPAEAFQIMRSFGMGISDSDISRIAVSESEPRLAAKPVDSGAVIATAQDDVIAESPAKPEDKAAPTEEDAAEESPDPADKVIEDSSPTTDCSESLACLADAAASGNAATASHVTLMDDGTVRSLIDLAYTTGLADGRPLLIMKTVSVTQRLSDTAIDQLRGAGYSNAEIAGLERESLTTVPQDIGSEDWCLFDSRSRLANVLRRWDEGSFTAADLDYASCCSKNADGIARTDSCDPDFPLSDRCSLSAHGSSGLTVGDEPNEWVTRYSGAPSEVTWQSSDEEVIRLTERTGSVVQIKAIGTGQAKITVTDAAVGPDCQVEYSIDVTEQ